MFLVSHLRSIVLPVCVLVFGIGLQLWQPDSVTFTRNLVFDQYNRWQPRAETGSPVVFIDIDEDSLREIGQFPWPRSVFAELVTRMTDSGVAAIAFDILFTEADRTAPSEILPVWQKLQVAAETATDGAPDGADWNSLRAAITAQITSPDDAFARALKNAPVVMATMMSDAATTVPEPKAGIAIRAQGGDETTKAALRGLPGSRFALVNRPVLNDNAMGLGSINARIDSDGIIRRASLLYKAGEHVFPSLSLETLRVAQRAGSIALKASDVRGEGAYTSGFGLSRLKVGQIIAPIEPDGSMRLYYAPSADIDTISAHMILDEGFDAGQLNGKIAFIGTSAAGLKDIRATPLDQATPGVEVHIQTVQQLIAGTYLKRPLWVQANEALATLVVGLMLIFMVGRFSIVPSMVFFIAAIGFGGAASWHQFTTALVLVDPALPTITVFATFLVAAFLHFLQTAREKREVRNAFQYYLAPDMVEQIAGNPDMLKLGGETRDLTILFCDIRGFTSISEAYAEAPEKLTHIINIFLTRLSAVIQNRAGTIDKYIGDNIMAFWGAPARVPHHAYEACRATLDMQTALKAVNDQLQNDAFLGGFAHELRIGIGLNSGDTLVGNVGSQQRFNYSVMGDTVNVAARLEGQTKDYGVSVLIGEATYRAALASIEAGAPPLAFLELDLIALKGKDVAERIYAVLGNEELASSVEYTTFCAAHSDMLASYRAQNWDDAQRKLGDLQRANAELGAYYTMLETRISAYRRNPPGQDWEGHYIALTK